MVATITDRNWPEGRLVENLVRDSPIAVVVRCDASEGTQPEQDT
jgi:hypothetical protein